MTPIHLDSLAPEADRVAADFEELARFTEPGSPGWSRRVFSAAYREERDWVAGRMRDAGLETSVDAAGNVVGRLAGKGGSPTPLLTGSHTDTVHGGGRFDGIVGVLGGIETARRFQESGTRLDHDLLVVDFLGEEANDFGISCIGSRAMSGVLTPEHLRRTDDSGLSLGAALTRFGCDPEAALSLAMAPGSLHAYVELHIEQGPLLESRNTEIGVVTGIAGIERLMATFTGQADHAGTRPMAERHDALTAAAQAILTVERTGCGAPVHGVTTTGKIESSPGAFNVVPDRARIWAEMRSVDAEWLHGAKGELARQIAEDAADRGVQTAIEWLNDQDPVLAAKSVQDLIGSSADALGYSWTPVPSGAGHDAAHMAHLGPMGMIFVPSVGGRSHCPEEWTALPAMLNGIHTLAATLVQLDKAQSASV